MCQLCNLLATSTFSVSELTSRDQINCKLKITRTKLTATKIYGLNWLWHQNSVFAKNKSKKRDQEQSKRVGEKGQNWSVKPSKILISIDQ